MVEVINVALANYEFSWSSLILTYVVLYIVKWFYNFWIKPLRSDVPTVGVPSYPFGSWVAAYKFISDSPSVMKEGFEKYGKHGKSFRISTPARWLMIASDETIIREIGSSDERILSMQAAANERNSISYLLNEYIHSQPIQVAISRKNVIQCLFEIMPEIVGDLEWIFDDFSINNGKWSKVNPYDLATESISYITNRILVGKKLASDREYLECVQELSKVIAKAGLIIDLSPRVFKSILARYLVPKKGPFEFYLSRMVPIFEERRIAFMGANEKTERPNDAFQWVLEAVPHGTSLYDMCMYILYLQFAAIHTSSVSQVNALCDLAFYSHFQDPIHDEITKALNEKGGWSKHSLMYMRKLDSSLRESQRLFPVTIATMMRKTLRPHVLADGTKLSRGDWVVVPAWAINRSTEWYSNPEEFNALRFSEMGEKDDKHAKYQMANYGDSYLSFGYAKHACPGRLFAATELKITLGYLIENYEFKVDEGSKTRLGNNTFCFSSAPDLNQELLFKRRG